MLTKGAIGNLVNRYKAVLKKCNLINTFGSFAVAAMLVMGGVSVAEATDFSSTQFNHGTVIDSSENIDLAGDTYTFGWPGAGSPGTTTLALQILEKANSVTISNGTIKVDNSNYAPETPKTQKPIKRIIQNYANLTIDGVTLDGRGINLSDDDTPKDYVASFANGTTTIKNSQIIANPDDYAFAVGSFDNYTGASVSVYDSTILGRVQMQYTTQNETPVELNFYNTTISDQTSNDADGGAIEIVHGSFTAENSTFSGNTTNATDGWGGAIFNKGTLTVKGGSFIGNIANQTGGAIASSTKSTSTTITGVTFEGNHAVSDGGAIAGFGPKLSITGSTFKNNTAQLGGANFDEKVDDPTAIGGGAIALGAVSQADIATISDTRFESNVSGYNGGAIATRMAKDANNSAAELKIAATFINNEAKASGGALYNTFYKGDKGVEVSGIFEGNKAGVSGGAIYNDGTQDKGGNGAKMTITDSTFSGNTAGNLGGAIYNSGTLYLEGNNTFSGNTDSTSANDIYNEGELTINGTASLAGGISGNGTLTGEAELVITDAAAVITNDVADDAKLSATATSAVTDQTGGNFDTLQKQLGEVELVKMEEGLIAGEVVKNADGSISKKANTVMQDALEMSTTAQLAVGRTIMNDVRKRMGDLRDASGEAGVWMRWDGGKLKGDEGLTNNFNTIQIGGDMLTGIKNVRAGVAAAFTHGDIDHNNGEGDMETYSFSAYATWMADNGMFADVIARVGFTNTELNVKGRTLDLDNEVLSLSGEYGWRLPICDQFYVEPQVELTYTYVTEADSKIDYATYEIDSLDSLIGRAGLVAGWKLPNDRGNLYARASVVHEFLGDSKITGSAFGTSIPYELNGDDTWLEYGIGANIKLTDKTYIWADVERTEGATIDEEWRGTVGLRISF